MAVKNGSDMILCTITCDCGNNESGRFFEIKGQVQCCECGSRYDQLFVYSASASVEPAHGRSIDLPRDELSVSRWSRSSADDSDTSASTTPRCNCGNDNPDGFFYNEEFGAQQCGACDEIVSLGATGIIWGAYHEHSVDDYDNNSGNTPNVSRHATYQMQVPPATCNSRHRTRELHLLGFDHQTKKKQLICPDYVDGCTYVTEVGNASLNARVKPTDRSRISELTLHRLQPADHVCFYRPVGDYWHHALVVTVDLDNKTLWIIHYSNDSKEFVRIVARAAVSIGRPYLASVRSDFVQISSDDVLYRVDYDPNDCFPPSVVLQRASERFGERRYDPLKNNCEHFARECKQEVRRSQQADDLKCTLVDTYKKTMPDDVVSKSIEAFVKFLKDKDPQTLMKELKKTATSSPKVSSADFTKLAKDIGEKWQLYHDGFMPGEEFTNYVVSKLSGTVFKLFPSMGDKMLLSMMSAWGLTSATGLLLLGLKRCLAPVIGPVLVRLLVYMTYAVVQRYKSSGHD